MSNTPGPDLDQYGRDADQRIDKTKPVDFPEVTGEDLYYAPEPVSARAHIGTPQGLTEALIENSSQTAPRVKQSRDRAQYVRQQKGHSLILHLLLGIFVLYINVVYISVSPNHYWHA